VVHAGHCREAFAHGTNLEQVHRLQALTAGMNLKLHAAASSLLHQPEAWLDAVRPGLALYDGAVRVTTRLVEVHAATGPIGYTGFHAERHGVVLVGYTGGLRRGWCVIHGVRRCVLEVGMQSAYVEVPPGARVGDEVVLVGDGLSPQDLAPEWAMTPQEVLLRLGRQP